MLNHMNLEKTKPLCMVLSTGGTIASRTDPLSGLAVPVCSVEELIAQVPGIDDHATIDTKEIFCIASPHIGPDQWRLLHGAVASELSRPDVDAVVISHGTALLEETAWFLDLTIESTKPVVLVGAQRNASTPDSDGPRNLSDAIRTAVDPQCPNLGVVVVMNQKIHAARTARKVHTFDVDAFDSGEWGVLGQITPEGVRFGRRPTRKIHLPLLDTPLPRVAIVPMYAGADSCLVDAAAKAYDAIVIEAVGAGHVNPLMYEAICRALHDGLFVVVTTRLPNGGARPCYGFTGSSQRLLDAGAIIGADLSAWKARVLLMLALQAKLSKQATQNLFVC